MVKKILEKVSAVFTKAATAVLIAVALITLLNIVLRSVFNAPISGAVEIVQVGMLIANAFALGEAGILDRHIAVPQLVDWFPKRIGSSFRTVTNLLGVVTFGYVSYHYFITVPEMARVGRLTDVLNVPMFVIYTIMAVCFGIATIMFVYWTVFHFIRIIHPVVEKPKEGIDAIDARDMLT